MKKSRLLTSAAAALSLVAVSACVTDPNTGERKVSRTAIGGVGGAGLGYLLGSVIGGKTARILGAGIGGVAGADSVARYLISRGVSSARIQTQGMGEGYPVADNTTPEGRALNRRVEIKITPVTTDEANAAR